MKESESSFGHVEVEGLISRHTSPDNSLEMIAWEMELGRNQVGDGDSGSRACGVDPAFGSHR